MEMVINLRDLFTKDRSELPDWVDSENVIYRIHNLINDKSYIGQAKWFYGRFVANPDWLTHYYSYVYHCIYGGYPIIYRALKKYKCRNFEVSIFEFNIDDLDSRESYYIKEFHTCIYDPECWGYNMTYGGKDTSQFREGFKKLYGVSYPLQVKSILLKKLETEKNNHGGILAFNTKQSYITRSNNPDWIASRSGSGRSGSGSMKQCHTPEAIANRMSSNLNNHNGILAWHTKDSRDRAYATNRERYGESMGWNTDYARTNWRKSILFNSINKKILLLKNNDLEVNSENYWRNSRWDHLENIFNYIETLKADNRWTNELDKIFSGMYYNVETKRVELI